MKYLQQWLILMLLLLCLSGCNQQSDIEDKSQQRLQQQAAEQGYPILIATPEIAKYGLPFCEKKYCIDIEIFTFNSQDQWFNQYTQQRIADLIRQQLGLSQKLDLQAAVDAFIAQSDAWQVENPQQKAWALYVKPRVLAQQHELVLLQMNAEYRLADQKLQRNIHYDVVDRKLKQPIRLYDLINPQSRIEFSNFIQKQYQNWQQSQQSTEQLPEKLYWANQDWFFDEQGIAIYYRSDDLSKNLQTDDLTIYLTPEQSQQWLKQDYLQQLNLL